MNWRTTAGGLLAAFIAASPAVLHFLESGFAAVTTQDWALIGAFISAAAALFHAKDKQN